MNLKDLKLNFKVDKHSENEYLLWDKADKSGTMFPHRYFCRVRDVSKGFYIILNKEDELVGKPEKDIEKFITSVNNYADSLPYHSDYYYPNYRPTFFIALCVQSYLRKLGFKNEKGSCDGYVLDTSDVYGGSSSKVTLSFDGLDTFDEKDEIFIYLHNSPTSYVKIECEQTEKSVIAGLNGLLKPLFLTNGIKSIELSDMLQAESFNGTLNDVNIMEFTMMTTEYRQELKNKLTEILNKL